MCLLFFFTVPTTRDFSSLPPLSLLFFFLNDPAPPEIYPFPLPAAFPISFPAGELGKLLLAQFRYRHVAVAVVDASEGTPRPFVDRGQFVVRIARHEVVHPRHKARSEEHTSELQSRLHLVCRLLLEKKKKQ